MRVARLGDDIDDYCIKCKRVMNHSVVSIVKDEPAKVRCRTCHSDHDFRHEQAPPKVEKTKTALFNQVLNNVQTGAAKAATAVDDPPAAPPAPEVEPVEATESAKSKGRKKTKP